MTKLFLFGLLFWLFGNPFVALLVLLIVLYLLDRRYIGIFPNVFRPFQLTQRLRRIRQELSLSPYNASLKLQAARILLEKRRYSDAMVLLDELIPVMNDSAEVWFEAGRCRLKLDDLSLGESHILQALQLNPRVRYGEPYLRLGEAYANVDQAKALRYLRQFQEIHSSSCEAYYRLGLVLEMIDQKGQAKQAYQEAITIYQSLPKYKRKSERRWAWLARRKKLS
ncbi:MAG: tetratricopeptide repeat protein [Paenibacillaceae bacterium]